MKSTTTPDKQSLQIREYFDTLYSVWGPQHWWPADSQFEVIVGAILTQNTAWSNVEKALANLREAKLLSVNGIRNVGTAELEQMVRPAGYFRQKTFRLKQFVAWIDARYGGSLARMFATSTETLRTELLNLHGIGPETADSILLYAGQHEIFVVDAYTRRVFERHRLLKAGNKYDEIRLRVESALKLRDTSPVPEPASALSGSLEKGPGPVKEVLTPMVHPPSAMSEAGRSDLAQCYNEFHALIVQVAKHHCQSRVARCESCPLRGFLESGRPFLPSKERGSRPARRS